MRIIRITQLLTAALLVFMTTTVGAQQPAAEQPQFDDATLELFASAFMQVGSIQQQYSASMGEAEDQQQMQSLQQEAQMKMAEAVRNSGLEVQTYNSIAQQLQSDTELQQRVMEYIE